ncbi:MAG: hydrogenase iron-sulfur subunit [Candidatus Eremiobacteraeota bacterium]|nr:hydrogenase iron-sulfur subunit [Candidatus Eremiobacteraeota bacterium]
MKEEFTPNILYFLCSWCGSGGCETAASYHMQYPENVQIARFTCTGTIATVHILRSLLEGADGVVISGCHPGDCHYNDGNFRARRKVAYLKSILNTLGLEPERVWFRYVAQGEARRFVDTAAEFNDHVKKLGPSPLKMRKEL